MLPWVSFTEVRRLIHHTTTRRMGAALGGKLLWVLSSQGVTLIVNIVIANLVGSNSFGRYAIVLSTVQAVVGVTSLGMGYTATKFLAEYRSRDRHRCNEILGFCLFMALAGAAIGTAIVVLLADVIAVRFLKQENLAGLVRMGACAVATSSINLCLVGILTGLECFSALALTGLYGGGSYLILSTGLTVVYDVQGSVAAFLVASLLQTVLLIRTTRLALFANSLRPIYRNVVREGALICRWVIPGMLSGLTAIPALWFAQSILARLPDGARSVALYTSAYNMMGLVLFLPTILNAACMPIINNLLGVGDESSYKRLFWANTGITLAVVVCGSLGVGLYADSLLRVYGTEFAEARTVLLILLIATVPESLTIALTQILQSKAKAWLSVLCINIPRDATLIIAAIKIVPQVGPSGLALAYMIARVVGALITATVVYGVGVNSRLDGAISLTNGETSHR